jgi:hypothetical protein
VHPIVLRPWTGPTTGASCTCGLLSGVSPPPHGGSPVQRQCTSTGPSHSQAASRLFNLLGRQISSSVVSFIMTSSFTLFISFYCGVLSVVVISLADIFAVTAIATYASASRKKQWTCPNCSYEMSIAPFRHYGEENSIEYDYPFWKDNSRVSYSFHGLIFPPAPAPSPIILLDIEDSP